MNIPIILIIFYYFVICINIFIVSHIVVFYDFIAFVLSTASFSYCPDSQKIAELYDKYISKINDFKC